MTSRTPAWVDESFNSITPETFIDPIPRNGDWLAISTNVRTKHRFSDKYPPNPPADSYGDGVHVLIEGPGSVTFRLEKGVYSLLFGHWSPGASAQTLSARFFDEAGLTLRDGEFRVDQKPHLGWWDTTMPVIWGVELSLKEPHASDIVAIDNFFTVDAAGKHAKELRQLKPGQDAVEAWLNSLPPRL